MTHADIERLTTGRLPGEGDDGAADEVGPSRPRWPWIKRFAFRFLAVYFVLYCLPFLFSYIPNWGDGPGVGGTINGWIEEQWQSAAPWVHEKLPWFEGELRIAPSGSGDTTYDFLKLIMMTSIAIVLAGVWSIFDWRKSHWYEARWLILGTRMYLGLYMMIYGMTKVIPTQMPYPRLTKMLSTYGDSSMMGLVWTFIGASPVFQIFTGLGELIGGLLLFSQRTRALGAAILVPVLSSVVMINYCYDVPVKLFSSHLLIMALLLLSLDSRRLLNVFLFNRPAPSGDLGSVFPWRSPWGMTNLLAITGHLMKVALLGYAMYTMGTNVWNGYHDYGAGREQHELFGIYDVTSFTRDGIDVPPLMTDLTRWRGLVIENPDGIEAFNMPGTVAIWQMDGSLMYRFVDLDMEAETLTMFALGQRQAGSPGDEVYTIERPDEFTMILRATVNEAEVEVHLDRRTDEEILFRSRGFNWIQEFPYNR